MMRKDGWIMIVFGYIRAAHKPSMTHEEQAALIRLEAEQRGFEKIHTGSSALDTRLFPLLLENQSNVQQAMVVLGE